MADPKPERIDDLFRPGVNKWTRQITTVDDVRAFFDHLHFDLKLAFHPDDDFDNYLDADGEDLMTDDQVIHYNGLMMEAFEVCNAGGADIYKFAVESFHLFQYADKLTIRTKRRTHLGNFIGWYVYIDGSIPIYIHRLDKLEAITSALTKHMAKGGK